MTEAWIALALLCATPCSHWPASRPQFCAEKSSYAPRSIGDLVAEAQPDPWFSDDKFRHFFMAGATVAYTHGATRALGIDADGALAAGIAAGIVASIGKEISDVRRGGPFSVPDLVWDAAGMAAAALLLREVR